MEPERLGHIALRGGLAVNKIAALLRTDAIKAASKTTRGRLEEMSEFYLALPEAMESALRRRRAKGAGGRIVIE
jgi:hypothetical protein